MGLVFSLSLECKAALTKCIEGPEARKTLVSKGILVEAMLIERVHGEGSLNICREIEGG